jgi:DNA polymerase (family 10)
MDNSAIADQLKLYANLLDIHGEDDFRAKSFGAASFTIDKLPYPLAGLERKKWQQIRGIGTGVAKAVAEIIDNNGRWESLESLLQQTPEGVVSMLQIKGIGPKKIHVIWKEMGIESIGELLYACQENRLTLYKGFGEKTQQAVEEAIRFLLQHQGHFLFAEIEAIFPSVESYLQTLFGKEKVAVTGQYRRQCSTLDELAFVVAEKIEQIKPQFITAQPPELLEETNDSLLYQLKNGLKLRIYSATENLIEKLFSTSGSETFYEAFEKLPLREPAAGETQALKISSETDLFTQKGLPYIPPYRRENPNILDKAFKGPLQESIRQGEIRGLIHSHSNWSDGLHTLEEMAHACIERKLEYMVISDHSASATYAKGLNAERVRAQHQQIETLNKQLAPFKIFKSIESDILNDGSLDYPDDVLKSFDLVIASVHSNLRMNQEKATARLIKAIENPFTRILGHLTGRLLLSRKGYPLDMPAILEACAQNKVAIELNAHPRRLDIDWEWIEAALEKGILLSINPDAHSTEGIDDTRYGIIAAQKGGLPSTSNLSSFPLANFEKWLLERKRN